MAAARVLKMRAALLGMALLLSPAALAQTDPVDAYIQAEMKKQNIPGLSLVVLKNGTIVKAAGYGVADREKHVPVTPDTVFKIGSVSKQFIASAILLLEQEGRLRLTDPIGKYLTDAPPAWGGITIRHLLTHTAGLMREAPGFDPWKVQADGDVIRTAYGSPLVFPPGEKWQYSNLGYFSLAEIIRIVSGRPWSEFIAERIFAPSGMKASRVTTTEPLPNRAKGYSDNDKLADAPDWPAVRPSGAFMSTVLDLAKWEGRLLTNTPLSQATRDRMWTRVTLNDGSTAGYGFGWNLGSVNGRKTVFHGGALPGFISSYQRFVDERLAVIVLLNTDDADVGGIALGVAALHLPSASKP